jgi:quercetin dioxygenase-like cupin family protein
MSQAIRILADRNATKLRFDWGHLTWWANRELGNSEEMTIGRCVLYPGQSNPRHYHPNCTEILTVISGRIRHTGPSDTEVEMGPGDTVTVLKNAWHRATNVGEGEAVLFIAFSSADRETIGE